ncbi:hypothetical protein [Salinimicrobium tongyeongense]|nr:hypothetical protein [Salinimicrobium tongyeongense]
MKKIFVLVAIMIFTLSSCRETTEVNTDGNMEKSDSGVQTREEN